MTRPELSIVLSVVILGLVGCASKGGSGTPTPPPSSLNISVNPSSITVADGSTTPFIAVFTPDSPEGGSLTWSVKPANGGTITNDGVFTASGSAGKYVVGATWTPTKWWLGGIVHGSGAVQVLAVAQSAAAISTGLVQDPGGSEVSGTTQNAGIVGQPIPSVVSTDGSGNIHVVHGFAIPGTCSESDSNCSP
jgi:hypothetical protein